jgi:acetylornithine/succinyldiaminopimelate/putrescine aminotransferase
MKRNRFDTGLLIFVSMLLTVTVGIGGSMPVGALMGSKNATIDGQVPLPHTTLLSGDSLHVSNGLAVVTLEQGNRMLLGRETEASFLREADRGSGEGLQNAGRARNG